MILDRFDGLVFVGDEMLAAVYAAFNMLMRENIVDGGLKQWKIDADMRDACRCDGQLMKEQCKAQMLMKSEEIRRDEGDGGQSNQYVCDRKASTYTPPPLQSLL